MHQAGVDDQDAGRVPGRVAVGLGDGRVRAGVARHGHRLVAGAGVDGDVHHVVAADHAPSDAALHRGQRAQRARDGRVPGGVALAGVGDLDADDAGAVGRGAEPAHTVGDTGGEGGEVPAHGVLHDLGLLPLAGEDDALLVEELPGVVGSHGQRHVGHGALDLPELLMESPGRHGVSSTRSTGAGAAQLS